MFYNRVIFSELQKMKPQAKTEKRDIVYDTKAGRTVLWVLNGLQIAISPVLIVLAVLAKKWLFLFMGICLLISGIAQIIILRRKNKEQAAREERVQEESLSQTGH